VLAVIIIAAIVVIAAMAFLATGRGGGLSAERGDYAPLGMGPVSATDVVLLRPPSELWGYSKQATEEAMGMIAESIRERDVRIVALEQLVTDLGRDHAPVLPLGNPYAGARHRRPPSDPFAVGQPPAPEYPVPEYPVSEYLVSEYPVPEYPAPEPVVSQPPLPPAPPALEPLRQVTEPVRARAPEPTHWSMEPVVSRVPPQWPADPASPSPAAGASTPGPAAEAAGPPPPEQSHD
jgi:hypothetical protein